MKRYETRSKVRNAMSDEKPAKRGRISSNIEGNNSIGGEFDLGTMDKLAVEVPADERNPMLNHVVMERFFELCDVSDLKHFRLVSKQWFEKSLTRWRNEKQVIIEGNIRNSRLSTVTRLYSPKVMEKPYKSYLLREFDFDNSSEPPTSEDEDLPPGPASKDLSLFEQKMLTFWEICGPSIHRLELGNCKFAPKFEDLTKLISGLPNLEVLIIRSPVLRSSESSDAIAYLFESGRMIRDWQPPRKLKSIQLYIDLAKCRLLLTVFDWIGLYSSNFDNSGSRRWEFGKDGRFMTMSWDVGRFHLSG